MLPCIPPLARVSHRLAQPRKAANPNNGENGNFKKKGEKRHESYFLQATCKIEEVEQKRNIEIIHDEF